ncbi:MAG: molybdate ABC transporter substrate-binding protein [Deltaproteobacteria bacterium]|nr:molybdate ABC transporter substrate-binding protein [Deltaproteobacteria bacterium]
MTRLRFLTVGGLSLLWGLIGLIALPSPTLAAEEPQLLVFGAASTTNALTDLGQAFQAQTGVKVVNSFASSSTLAKQIKEGAPAAVFLSANVKWVDFLEKDGDLLPDSRSNLLRNRLVLIAPADSPQGKVTVDANLPLAGLLGDGRLSLGDPSHVPAGIYAKEALRKLGLWDQVQDKVAAAANVRAALALVETGEAPLGLVYSTDAAISTKVKVLGMFPADSHQPIVYPVALIKGQDSPAAHQYLEFLRSPKAQEVFAKYGFLLY